MKNVAYCPINLPRVHISETILNELFCKYKTDHHDNLWHCLPLIGRTKDFSSAASVEEAWEKRYNTSGHIYANDNVYTALLPLFHHMTRLPILVTHAQILCQIADVGKHYDLKNDGGKEYFDDFPKFNDEVEPANYKILLNQYDQKSFYVAEGFGKSNMYISLPHDTNTFVINEKTYPHGATLLKNRPKYTVSIFGLIDKKRHINLVSESIDKYQDFVISF